MNGYGIRHVLDDHRGQDVPEVSDLIEPVHEDRPLGKSDCTTDKTADDRRIVLVSKLRHTIPDTHPPTDLAELARRCSHSGGYGLSATRLTQNYEGVRRGVVDEHDIKTIRTV
jgi:hypothetical protein